VEFNPFENGRVELEQGHSNVDAIVSAYEFTLCAGTNRNIGITVSPKHLSLVVRLFVPVLPYIFAGGESGGLDEEFSGCPWVEGFVIDVGRRVGCSFCSDHLKGKAKKRKKKAETKV